MFRVFMTGSYKPPREFNWVIGVNLLVMTLMLSFTGYLLPWDQLSIWAVTVGTNMGRATPMAQSRGPSLPISLGVDATTLRARCSPPLAAHQPGRRWSASTCCTPSSVPLIAALVLMIVHFWRVRKDGGISGPL